MEYCIIFRVFQSVLLHKNHFILDRTRHTIFHINSINEKIFFIPTIGKKFLENFEKNCVIYHYRNYINHRL